MRTLKGDEWKRKAYLIFVFFMVVCPFEREIEKLSSKYFV